MKESSSYENLRQNLFAFEEKKDSKKKPIKKLISFQNDNIKKEILNKLNEGSILHFIRNTARHVTNTTTISENSQEMKYDLSMLHKYEEDLNSSLSFISEFDLENEEDNSFNSSFDGNSVEEIDIVSKTTKQKRQINI